MRHSGARISASALRRMRFRQTAGVQLQTARVLPVVQSAAHGAKCGLSGGPCDPGGAGTLPSSFAPSDYHPGLLRIESRVSGSTCDALSGLGHRVQMWSDYNWRAGGVCAVMHAPDSGEVSAAADPRRAGSAFIDPTLC